MINGSYVESSIIIILFQIGLLFMRFEQTALGKRQIKLFAGLIQGIDH